MKYVLHGGGRGEGGGNKISGKAMNLVQVRATFSLICDNYEMSYIIELPFT